MTVTCPFSPLSPSDSIFLFHPESCSVSVLLSYLCPRSFLFMVRGSCLRWFPCVRLEARQRGGGKKKISLKKEHHLLSKSAAAPAQPRTPRKYKWPDRRGGNLERCHAPLWSVSAVRRTALIIKGGNKGTFEPRLRERHVIAVVFDTENIKMEPEL